jgi:hypothetical protein
MSVAANNLCLVVTNPFHFTYLRRQMDIRTIGSDANTLFKDNAEKLGFANNLTFYPVANSLKELIAADQSHHPADSYLTWKVVQTDAALLGNAYDLAHNLERKTFIRSLLPKGLFPDFVVVRAAEVAKMTYAGLSERLMATELVLQVDFSTGGRGTYFISNAAELEAILPSLKDEGQDIVVSKRIRGISRGVQCLISHGQTYHMDWWHQDLVGLPEICALDVPGASRYCGAVLQNIPSESVEQVHALVEKVGEILQSQGYQGVFGIDIVVESETGRVYLIEVNPRFTAVSHMYATAMHAVGYESDFLMTAVMDTIGMSHEMPDYRQPRVLPVNYFYMKVQNTLGTNVSINGNCRLGVYDGQTYQRFGFGVGDLQKPHEIVVIPEGNRSTQYAPGARLFSVIGTGGVIEGAELSSDGRQLVGNLRAYFTE